MGSGTGKNSRQQAWISGICAAAVMLMIFLFSSQDGEASTRVSSGLLEGIIQWVRPLLEGLCGREMQFTEMELILRKCGHFCEYGLLGLTLSWHLIRVEKPGWGGLAQAAGTLYAITDELHQLFSEGRSASPVDVLIDSMGVLAGILLVWMIRSWSRRRRPAEQPKQKR